MKLRLLALFIVPIAVICATTAAPASAQTAGAPKHASAPGASGTHDPELSPLQPLAGRIGLVGQSRYRSSFAGVQIEAGVLDVYVVPRHDRAFLGAVSALDSAHFPYTVKYVPRSYAVQVAASRWLMSNLGMLRREGIVVQWGGAHPSDDAVLAALQAPTGRQLTDLRTAVARVRQAHLARRPLQFPAATQVTRSTYIRAAAALLNAQAPHPGDIVISPALAGTITPVNSNYGPYGDESAFDGADQINYELTNENGCTSNFSVNISDQDYMMTAAHCSGFPNPATGHDFYTCATRNSSNNCDYNMGTVSTVYFSNNDDYELIPSSVEGYVWNDTTSARWSVNGYITVATGDHLTINGTSSGATYDVDVEQALGATFFNECEGGNCHIVDHAIVLNTSAIAPGDSGGTILQRESDGVHIYAAGIIQATNGTLGYGQQIYWLRDESGVRLIFGN
jgi:hypothetical protein